MDVTALKDRTRAMWTRGNYGEFAPMLEPAAEALVDVCAISAGQEVLDVAAGTGNVAVLAARGGASVVASDLTPLLLEQGRARAEAEGLAIEWVEADAEDLPFEDERFDCVTSCFGAMFAPRPGVAARELFRVARPGGVVGMANWTPQSFQARWFAVGDKYAPRPEELPLPVEWGIEEVVGDRLGGLAARMDLERRDVHWRFLSREAMWDFLATNAGPVVAARETLDPPEYEALEAETLALIDEWNRATDGSVAIDAEYLLVLARKPG